MLTERMEAALNAQVNAELYSSYLYLSMAAYFKNINLAGFSRWMEAQALEEQTHAWKFYNFIHERSGQVVLKAIDGPPTHWDSPIAVFQDVCAHEQKVTRLINDLVDLAIDERDHATNNFLQWFVAEQVEEEASVDEVVQKLKLMGDAKGALFMLDQELGRRTVMLPPEVTFITTSGN
jgi:ferritin